MKNKATKMPPESEDTRRQLEALREATLAIATEEKLEDRLRAIVEAACELLDAKGGKVYTKVEGRELLKLEAIKGISANIYPPGTLVSAEEGMVGEVYRTKKPLIINNYSKYPRRIKRLTSIFGAVIEVPLMFGGRVIGVLAVFDSKNRRTFSQSDVPILKRFATHVVLAIRDAQNLQAAQGRAKDLTVVNHIVKTLGSHLSTGDLFRAITEEITKALHCNHCTLFLIRKDETGKQILFPEQTTNVGKVEKVTRVFASNEGLIGLVFKQKRTRIFNDAFNHPGYVAGNTNPRVKSRSILVSPILRGRTVIGIICADQDEINWFEESNALLVDALAAHAAVAIERALSLDAFGEISNRLIENASLDNIESVLSLILEGAVGITDASVGAIFLFGKDSKSIQSYVQFPPNLPYSPLRKNKRSEFIGLTKLIYETGKPVIIEDTSRDKRVNPNLRKKIKSILGVPLKFENKVIGVMYLDYFRSHAFTGIQKSIVYSLAGQAAIAVRLQQSLALTEFAETSLVETTAEFSRQKSYELIVHDVKQLMVSVGAGLKNIQEAQLEKATNPPLKNLVAQVQRSCDSIDELLKTDFYGEVEISNQDFTEVLNFVLGLLHAKLLNQEIRVLIKRLGTIRPIVTVNRSHLIMILFNLIDNSANSLAKVSREKYLEFEISVDEQKQLVNFIVKDNGIGMKKADKKRVFDDLKPPYQVKGKRGRGVYSVVSLLSVYEGKLDVDTEHNKGCTIRFSLPLAD